MGIKEIILAATFCLGIGIAPFTMAQSVTLTPVTGKVQSQIDGELIENLDIDCTNEPQGGTYDACLRIVHANVTVRNVRIRHTGTLNGLRCHFRGDGMRVENVDIVHVGVPKPNKDAWTATNGKVNIVIEGCNDVIVNKARVEGGAAGVYVLDATNVTLQFIQAKNMRGPFPAGQAVQFNKSPGSLLEDFSVFNDPDPTVSWPEDNISSYKSPNNVVRRGFIDGNNSTHGVGVMFETGSSNGLAEDVDTINMGNGAFTAWSTTGVDFVRTRWRDQICTDQGRGLPASGGQGWVFSGSATGGSVVQGEWWNKCWSINWNPGGAMLDFIEVDFTDIRQPLDLVMDWEAGSPTPTPTPSNNPPVAMFSDPLQGAEFDEGHDLQVTVAASDPDGIIQRVELYFDGNFVRQELVAPYFWQCSQDAILCNLAARGYHLTAKAFDNEGAETMTTVDIVVNLATPTPTPIPPSSDLEDRVAALEIIIAEFILAINDNATNIATNTGRIDGLEGDVAGIHIFLDNTFINAP